MEGPVMSPSVAVPCMLKASNAVLAAPLIEGESVRKLAVTDVLPLNAVGLTAPVGSPLAEQKQAKSTMVQPSSTTASNGVESTRLQFTTVNVDPAVAASTAVHVKCHAGKVVSFKPADANMSPARSLPDSSQGVGMPTGRPPTIPTPNRLDGSLVQTPSVDQANPLMFKGSLEELLQVVENGSPGLVVDLQGAVILSEKHGGPNSRADTEGGPTADFPSNSASPRSSNSLDSLESGPSELLMVGHVNPQPGSSGAVDKLCPNPTSPDVDEGKSADLHQKSSGLATPTDSQLDLEDVPPRVLMRHVTSHRSKQLQQERKTASRSNPSNPMSLASAYDSKEIVSKALSQKGDDAAPPSFTLKGRDVTIRNGTINLPVDFVLLLLNDARINFEDLVVTGPGRNWDDSTSFPLVHVEGGRVTMTRVVISGNQSGHGLTLGIGSYVTLRNCVFECNDLSGVMVGGTDCHLHASSCTFNRNLQDGVIVCRGAVADFEHCQFTSNDMLGLEVAFAGAVAQLRACKLEKNMEHGVSAYSGASLTMESCEIKNSHRVGVSVLDETTRVKLHRCDIRENRHEGILACQSIKLTATKCKITNNRVGVEAAGAETMVKLAECQLLSNSSANIVVNTAAAVDVLQSTCADSKGKGVSVVHPGSKFHASKSVFSRCATTGVHVSKISCAHLEHCVLEHNQISGAHVTDTGSSMLLEHCRLALNQTIGVFANKAGDVTLKHCEISGNGSTGTEVRDRQARMLLANCVVRDNKRVGVYSHSAAVATLVACVVKGNGVKAMLVGGRENMEMGGGIIEYDRATEVDGDIMMRHSGRALLAEADALTQSLTDNL